jgi:hypothetical protein
MQDDPTLYRALAAAERRLAETIAERAVAHPDPDNTKALRALWRIASTRADYFEEFANAG